MNKNVIIVVAGGFLIAVLVALLVQATLGGKKKTAPVVQEVKKVEILVAKAEVKAGAKVDVKNVRWAKWPEDAVFPGAIIREDKKKIEDTASGVFIRSVAKDQPITKDMLADDATSRFLAASISPGKRAFSVKVKPEQMVSGFIGPGDYVDVLLTYEMDIEIEGLDDRPDLLNYVREQIDEQATETVLQNIKVLGIDQGASRQEDGLAKLGKTVTLEVTLQQAEVVALSQSLGELSFALRKLGDDKIYEMDHPVLTDMRVTTVFKDVIKGMLEAQFGDADIDEDALAASQQQAVSDSSSSAMPQLGGQGRGSVKVFSGSGVQSVTVGK